MTYRMSYIRLLADNYRDMFRFYRDTLGMDVIRGDVDSHYAELGTGDVRLSIFRRSEMLNALGLERDQLSSGQGAALVFAVEDVDSAFRDLERRGVRFIIAPRTHRDWSIRTAHFRDPEGNLIEINQRLTEQIPTSTS